MRYPSWVGDILLACLREHDWAASPEGLDHLIAGRDLSLVTRAARDHHVEPCVYRSLALIVPADHPGMRELASVHQLTRRNQLLARGAFLLARTALGDASITFLVIKGPVLAELVYATPDLRRFHDVDLVVPRSEFAAAAAALEAAGFNIVGRDWVAAREELAGEVDLVSPTATPVDLHWALIYHEGLRRGFSIHMDELFDRATTVSIAGGDALTLDPTDTLMHLCLHAFRQGGGRLQWLKDIERSIARRPPDWDALVARAAGADLALVTGVLLHRAHRTLDAFVPPTILEELLPPGWRRIVTQADRLAPIERSTGGSSLSSIVTRSTRQSPTSSLLSLGVTGFGRLREAVGRRPANHRGATSPAGGSPDARSAYFAAVSGGDG